MRYELQIKQVSPAGGGEAPGGLNPALLARQSRVTVDDGRGWAGDLYEEGPVTDPAESYAHFGGGEDTEAWLDRNEDGTLTGWVREGDAVWRYSDVEAWALDVDGAQMPRVDAAGQGVPGEDPATAPAGDPNDPAAGEFDADAGMDPLAEPDPEAEAEAAAVADQGLPDENGFVNPFAVTDEDNADEEPEDGLAQDETLPVELPDTEDTDEGDDEEAAADEDAETAEDEDTEESDEDEDDGLPFKVQKKSLEPGILPGPTRRPRGTIRPRRSR